MPSVKNLTGQTFNRLTIISLAEKRNGRTMWLCKCSCGKKTSLPSRYITSGHTKSCGCLKRETTINRNKSHELYGTPEYKTLIEMIRRCYNPNCISYKNYGGRGISVTRKWYRDGKLYPEEFIKDIGLKPSAKYSIERIDNNGDYTPENCRWATKLEQAHNTRANRHITYNGTTLTLAEWSRKTGIGHKTISHRLNIGWSVFHALFTPPKSKRI